MDDMGLRTILVETTRYICEHRDFEWQQPCPECIDKAAHLHYLFHRDVGRKVLAMKPRALRDALQAACYDG